MNALPIGWASATVGDTGRFINGLAFKPEDWGDVGRPIIRIQNLTNEAKPFNRTTSSVDDDYVVRSGDILVSWSATLDAFFWRREEGILNQHIFRVLPHSCVDRSFLFYLLKSAIAEMRASEHLHGSTMKHINRGPFLAHEIRLPPLNEQRRIVEKLDAIFEKSRAAKARLERLPALLDQLKRSILAAAFRGDLTKDWRAANPDVESASVLLERIRAERRRKWEEGLRAKGKDPKKATYEEPAAVDTSELPELPSGWTWASLEIVAAIQGGIQKQPSRVPVRNKFPFLRVANVHRGRLDLRDVHEIELFDGELDRLRLEAGDLLIVEGNGSPSEIGRAARWDGSVPDCVHQNHLIRARPSPGISASFLENFWNSPVGIGRVVEVAHTTTGLLTLSVGKIAPIPVPVAPQAEQLALTALLTTLLDSLAALHVRVARMLTASTEMEQAALAKAFRGELVLQDPNDEPADVLLERLRSSTNAAPAARRTRGPRTVDAPPATTAATVGDPVDGIVSILREQRRQSASAIVAATGLDAAKVKTVLKSLERLGKVTVEGKARGTTYVWNGDA